MHDNDEDIQPESWSEIYKSFHDNLAKQINSHSMCNYQGAYMPIVTPEWKERQSIAEAIARTQS